MASELFDGAGRVDLEGRALVFETLKKCRRGVYRAVPVPATVLDALDLVHGVREAQKRRNGGERVRLWPWARSPGCAFRA